MIWLENIAAALLVVGLFGSLLSIIPETAGMIMVLPSIAMLVLKGGRR